MDSAAESVIDPHLDTAVRGDGVAEEDVLDSECDSSSLRLEGLSESAMPVGPFACANVTIDAVQTFVESPDQYYDYLRRVKLDGKCLMLLRNGPDEVSATFALPPYDSTALNITHGAPVLVEFHKCVDVVSIICKCPAARLGVSAMSSPNLNLISCLKDGKCWHDTSLRCGDLFDFLVSSKSVVKCDPATGLPVTDFVRIIGSKYAAAEPSRIYVAAYSRERLGSPGNLRLAVVTLSLKEGCLKASCDACGNASKSQMGAKKGAKCVHFALIKDKATCVSSTEDGRYLQSFFLHADTKGQQKASFSNVFNTVTNRWAFPSLDLRTYEDLS